MLRKLLNKIYILLNIGEKEINKFRIHPTAKLYNYENIQMHSTSLITEYVIIRSPKTIVNIGEYSQIGPFAVIISGECGIKIGNNVMIAPHCVLAEGKHEYRNLKLPMIEAGSFSDGPIVIEDDVWIGANCTIVDNVRIGKGAIVGANSFVNRNVNPYEIVGGVPIKSISSRLIYK